MFNLGELGQQIVLLSAILFAVIFWIKNKIRYDLVAIIALAIIVVGGIIPFERTFSGFINPAVIIVIAVLIMSKGIINTGFVDFLISKIPLKEKKISFQILALTIITAFISAFVYNIGALAIIMPLAIGLAKKKKVSSAYYLMPIAFAANMGGFLTLIGNAPNIIISSFQEDLGMESFQMFDYGKVGIWLVLASIFFISIIGWRFMPKRKEGIKKEDISKIENYTSEFFVPEDSEFNQKTIKEIKEKIEEDFTVLNIIRNNKEIIDTKNSEIILERDLILVKTNTEILKKILNLTDFKLNTPKEKSAEKEKRENDIIEAEGIISPSSKVVGLSLEEMEIDFRFAVEVVAISRDKQRIKEKLKDIKLKKGDVLLLRGKEENINRFLNSCKLLPLMEKNVQLKPSGSMVTAFSIFLLTILSATFGILPVEISFFLGAIAMVVTGTLTIKEVYENIDWSIVVVLGAIIPFGEALIVSGSADLISSNLLNLTSQFGPLVILAIVLAIAIILSSFINNIGAAVLMAPIAILLAQRLGVSSDPFLMAVAIGASCAFLTPVGHQVNLLVMEPGGYKFTDYWKMGIFLNLIIFVIAILLLPVIWPF